MKRSEFIRWLQQHDIYVNLKNGKKQPVPRHNEIDDLLVKHIKKQLGLDA